jgi:hypothetical protein
MLVAVKGVSDNSENRDVFLQILESPRQVAVTGG